MAKNYNDIYTAVYTKGNKMDFGNSMIRGNAIPLDITAVYNSYSAAQAYVNSNPVAYEGQVLAVTENNDTVVYVIAARLATDGTTVEHYLKEVGKTPEVDNVTIKLVDGKLTAVIPDYEDTDTQYTLSVLADGKIAFASDIDGEEATEISFVGAQGITVTSNADTGVITITGPDLSGYATKTEVADKANAADVYTKDEADDLLAEKANTADVYTKEQVDDLIEVLPTFDDVYTKTEVDDIVDGLEEEIGKKANAADVYTKTETDEQIGKAVAAADHLKRKIVDTKEEINIDAEDAMQYIYMIPSGLTASDNKYYEYIVLEENGVRYIEQVGNWEVDLKDYLTSASAEETYAKKNEVAETYATKAAVAETYATKAEVATTLEAYDTAEEIAEVYATKESVEEELKSYSTSEEVAATYATKDEVNTALEDYDTAEEVAEVYATKAEVEEEFKSYSTTEEIANEYVSNGELETALEPYAKKTDLPTDYVSDAEFEEAMKAYDTAEVSKGKYADKGETELALGNRYTKEETNSLLAGKVDNSTATAEDGIRFINQVEISKLSKLNLEGDDITISGSVNASQVKELYPTVVNIIKGSASDLDPDSEGNQLGLGIEEGAQVNKIDSVSNEFVIDENKQLSLKDGGIAIAKIASLQDILDSKATVQSLTDVDNRLQVVESVLNDTLSDDGTVEAFGLVSQVATLTDIANDHEERIEALEGAIVWKNLGE